MADSWGGVVVMVIERAWDAEMDALWYGIVETWGGQIPFQIKFECWVKTDAGGLGRRESSKHSPL